MKKDNYDVGYKKPPKHTQFKPGQSGNPKGRPKKPTNMHEAIIDNLGKKIKIKNPNGKVENVYVFVALARMLIKSAIDGNKFAMQFLLEKAYYLQIIEPIAEKEEPEVDQDKKEELEKFVKELLYERTVGKNEPSQSND